MAIDPAILEKIRTNHPDLTFLSLSQKDLDKNDIQALADALKNNHILTKFTINGHGIGNIGHAIAIALASALGNNHTLNLLYLNHNSIGDTGAIALINALKNNRSLTALYLKDNNICNASITALADALIKSKNILYVEPATPELEAHYKDNNAIAKALIKKIKSDPDSLTRDDRQEIRDRIPAILATGQQWSFNMSREQTFEMLASIGIKPPCGPITQKVNAAREAQRQAAINDPSQGI